MRLNTFCGINIRTGGKIIAGIDLAEATFFLFITGFSGAIFKYIIAGTLLYGIERRSHRFLLPWLIQHVFTIFMGSLTVFSILLTRGDKDEETLLDYYFRELTGSDKKLDNIYLIFFAGSVMFFGMVIYFWLVIFTLYQQISDENQKIDNPVEVRMNPPGAQKQPSGINMNAPDVQMNSSGIKLNAPDVRMNSSSVRMNSSGVQTNPPSQNVKLSDDNKMIIAYK